MTITIIFIITIVMIILITLLGLGNQLLSVAGTTENLVCNNQGLCDYNTGIRLYLCTIIVYNIGRMYI